MNKLTIFSWFGFPIPMEDKDFWIALDQLVEESEIIIDRSKGNRHPRYHNLSYEVDYGYLKGTSSMDGHGIDLWRGTKENPMLDAIICTVDLRKKDSEIKLLLGCTAAEKEFIYRFHNQDQYLNGILIERDPNSL